MANNYNFKQLEKNLNQLSKKAKQNNQPVRNNRPKNQPVRNNRPKNQPVRNNRPKNQPVRNNRPIQNNRKTVANKVKLINTPIKKVRFREYKPKNKQESNVANYILFLFLICVSGLCIYLLYEIYNTKPEVPPHQPTIIPDAIPNNYNKNLNKYILRQNKYISDINERVRDINKCRLHSSKYLRDNAILSQIRENERQMANEVALEKQSEPVLY